MQHNRNGVVNVILKVEGSHGSTAQLWECTRQTQLHCNVNVTVCTFVLAQVPLRLGHQAKFKANFGTTGLINSKLSLPWSLTENYEFDY